MKLYASFCQCVCTLLRVIKALSYSGVTLLHVFNDLYMATNKCLSLVKCSDNFVSVNLKLPS